MRSLESVAVAFSSGVDSTFLLKVAKDTLGDKVMAVTAQSCSFPKRELKEAIAFCEKEGIKHNVLNAKYHEQEAEIVADAGGSRRVTIATNMAGRGTGY